MALANPQAGSIVDTSTTPDVLQRDMFVAIAKDLRLWSRHIIGHAPPGTAGLLTTYVEWLDNCARALTPTSFQKYSFQSGCRGYFNRQMQVYGRYKSFYMIHVLIFSFYLRGLHGGQSATPFIHIIQRAMATLPPEAQGVVNQMIEGAQMPSASVISRFRLYLDVTYMKYMREVHHAMIQAGGVCFGLMDSSPQGRDYLMHRYKYLSWDNLELAADLADQMFACHGSF